MGLALYVNGCGNCRDGAWAAAWAWGWVVCSEEASEGIFAYCSLFLSGNKSYWTYCDFLANLPRIGREMLMVEVSIRSAQLFAKWNRLLLLWFLNYLQDWGIACRRSSEALKSAVVKACVGRQEENLKEMSGVSATKVVGNAVWGVGQWKEGLVDTLQRGGKKYRYRIGNPHPPPLIQLPWHCCSQPADSWSGLDKWIIDTKCFTILFCSCLL